MNCHSRRLRHRCAERRGAAVMRELGPALRQARERRELTQTEVMAMTGINNKTLSGYENGVSEPDLQTLTTLLRLYQVQTRILSYRANLH